MKTHRERRLSYSPGRELTVELKTRVKERKQNNSFRKKCRFRCGRGRRGGVSEPQNRGREMNSGGRVRQSPGASSMF